MAGPLERTAYALGQGARAGLYWGQYWLSGRLTTPVRRGKRIEGPVPGTERILRDLRGLFEKDWRNIEAGYYRMPHDLATSPIDALARAARYFQDLPKVERRRHSASNSEVFTDPHRGRYPRYFLQNFHYQTDGYLSRRSAELYDHQVEVLFGGGADAMRRQALVPLHHFFEQRQTVSGRLLDLGCGTGKFLTFVKDNYPRLSVTALDLSPYYLETARRRLRPWRGTEFIERPAEESGLGDASFDIVTAVYLFHELPAKVRRQVTQEIARILKPGGLFVMVDSLQFGDVPDYDGLIESFPVAFHEPYYADYARSDLEALFAQAGLDLVATDIAYFSRIMSLQKRG